MWIIEDLNSTEFMPSIIDKPPPYSSRRKHYIGNPYFTLEKSMRKIEKVPNKVLREGIDKRDNTKWRSER